MRIGCIALVFALLAAGCGDDKLPTTPGETPTETLTFVGDLVVQGTNFTSFSVATAGELRVTLVSLTSASTIDTTSPPETIAVGLGVGVTSADGLSCALGTSVNVAPALTAQIVSSVPVGTTCVQILDVGNLLATVKFVIRIVHT